ncbi:hypothetical protein Desaci_2407 [Desulfosporosinus acidiphilus SJ4]|uniref:Uncharacterized protein n=1 Tax=Desulfosporosinus acidiphilus (strain DSM 22704 / JCM 16185 / SJ4) TaxID=646529 RepID=I4D6D5_DESAJ|nr:hypothetical protein Desaci_2407 [Desulfosporosinus acidiphilus SJ4]
MKKQLLMYIMGCPVYINVKESNETLVNHAAK